MKKAGILIFLCAAINSIAAPVTIPNSTGLVAAYPLDGDAADLSDNAAHGTLHGTTPASDRFGRTNAALRFNGTSDYIDLGNRPEFNFTNSFTLNAWIKIEGGNNAYVLGKYSYSGPNEYAARSYGLGIHEGHGPYGFVVGDGSWQDVQAWPSLADDQWHLITLAYEKDTTVRLYSDGQLRGQRSTGLLPPLTNSLPLLIGKIASGLNFHGLIDEITIFNRSLSSSEISSLHLQQQYLSGDSAVPLQQPTATFSQTEFGDYSVATVIDGVLDNSTAWGIYPSITNQTAVFETMNNEGYPGGTVFTFRLFFNHPSVPGTTSHALGRFRLSATTDHRDSFANGLPSGGNVTANWSVLKVLSASATSDATFTILPDESLLLSSNISHLDTYTVSVATRLTNITGVRLEALTHESLPHFGPGREPLNGNFALSEMLVSSRPGLSPLITQQPGSLTVTNSTQAELSVIASSSLDLTYQWFLNGSPIDSATNATLTIAPADWSHAGTYTVAVQNDEGVTFSNPAVLTIIPSDATNLATLQVSNAYPSNAPISDIFSAPLQGAAFLAQVYAGPTAETLTPTGPAVPFLAGDDAGLFVPLNLILTNVPAGSNAFVQIKVWESAAGSNYMAAVENGGQFGYSQVLETSTGDGSPEAPYLTGLEAFSLLATPRLLTQPSSQSVLVGESAMFHVEAWGSSLSYLWFLQSNVISSATSSTLTLTNLQVENSGEVYVIVSNSVGSVTSLVTTLLVQVPDTTPPSITVSSPVPGQTTETHISLSGSITDDRTLASAFWTHNDSSTRAIANLPFHIPDIPLVRGLNTFTVSAIDASGNSNSVTVTITNVAQRAVYVGAIPPVQEGAPVEVPILLQSQGGVGGFTFDLIYPRELLSLPEVQWEDAVSGAVTQSNTNFLSSVRASFALSGSAVPTGSVHVATIKFRARSVPVTSIAQLRLSLSGLFSPSGDPLSPVGTDVNNGSVQITVREYKGDNNANDRLDVGDASIIMRFINNLEPMRFWDTAKNDLNANSQLDAGDVIRVLRAVVGLDPQPGSEPPTGNMRRFAVGPKLSLVIDKGTATSGEQVKVLVNLSQLSSPLSAASFKLQYPPQALKLVNASSHKLGSIVPTSAAALWNISPAQNNYELQDGTLALAVSADRAWPTNQGALAELTFTVQPAATNQHRWPITIQQGELSAGFDLQTASGNQIFFEGRPATSSSFTANPSVTETNISLTLNTEVGLSYRVEFSDDLVNWTDLKTLLGTGAPVEISIQRESATVHRFYRAVQLD